MDAFLFTLEAIQLFILTSKSSFLKDKPQLTQYAQIQKL